jgi:hypothetical protein
MNESERKQNGGKASRTQHFVFFLSLVFFVGTLLYATGVLVRSSPGKVRPSLVCESLGHDFGEIERAELPEHTFVLMNRGKRPVSIRDVRPGCGSCVHVVSYTQSPILPGEKGFVTLQLLAPLLEGEDVSKDTLVMTDDPVAPVFLLILNAKIPPNSGRERTE